MRITTLTAGPALNYLLAEAGYEEPNFTLRPAWPIFLRFLAEPSESKDVASFQVNWAEEDAGAHMLIVSCTRELTDEAGGLGPATRSAGLQFIYELTAQERARVKPVAVWLPDFPTIEAFAAHVQALPIFERACVSPAYTANVVIETLDEGDARPESA